MDEQQIISLVNKLIDLAIPFCVNLVFAVVIYIVGKWLAKVISNLVEKLLLKSNVDEALVKFLKNIVNISIIIFTILAAISKLGIQTTSFIAVLGAAGLAVGMALQGTLSNFASGVMLILFKPFKIGDFIEGAGIMGSVKEIQIFNTILTTPDNRKVILPNSKIASDTITNYSDIDQRRIDLVFGVSYSDDLKVAKQVLLDLVASDQRILKDPEPTIAVAELGDSSVNIICRPWVKPDDYWDVRFDLLEKGKQVLEDKGCSIPFPQRDVHLYQEFSE